LTAIGAMQARTHKALGDIDAAIASLHEALGISEHLEEHSGDVDTLGALADIYVEKGDLVRASELYDRVIAAIRIEDETTPLSSSWDC
jgi:tetratricopeptide (TPR) repeat protein